MNESVRIVCPACDATNRVSAARLGEGRRCGACKAPLFQAKPVALTEERFRRHLWNSDLPLLVDLWASWCGPCRMMAPAFEQAAQLEPRMRLVKVSTEEASAIAAELGIRSIPTLALVAGGREVTRQAGALPTPASSPGRRVPPRRLEPHQRAIRTDGAAFHPEGLRSPYAEESNHDAQGWQYRQVAADGGGHRAGLHPLHGHCHAAEAAA